jgi:hypothetical protein
LYEISRRELAPGKLIAHVLLFLVNPDCSQLFYKLRVSDAIAFNAALPFSSPAIEGEVSAQSPQGWCR